MRSLAQPKPTAAAGVLRWCGRCAAVAEGGLEAGSHEGRIAADLTFKPAGASATNTLPTLFARPAAPQPRALLLSACLSSSNSRLTVLGVRNAGRKKAVELAPTLGTDGLLTAPR